MKSDAEIDDLSNSSKEVAKGSFWGLLGNLTVKLISFVYAIIIARFASPNDVGTFYLVLGISMIAGTLSEFGLLEALNRYVPYFEGRNEHRKISDLLNFSYLSVILACVVGIFFYIESNAIGALYQNASLPLAIRIFSLLFLLNGILKVAMAFLMGKADMKSRQFLDNLQNVFKVIFTLILFDFMGASVVTLSLAFVLSYLPSMLLSFFIVNGHVRKLKLLGDGLSTNQMIYELAPFGFMLGILTTFSVIITSIDQVLLGYLLPSNIAPTQLAIYSIATGLAAVLTLFPSAVGSIFLPVASRLLGKEDSDSINSLIQNSQRWTIFITLPVGLIFIIFSKELLVLFYGNIYGSGALTLSIFTLGLIFQAFTYLISLLLAAKRRVDIELITMGVAAIVNFFLNLFLIPILGINGSAIASTICFLVSSILLFLYARKLFNFKLSSDSYKLAICALFVGVLLFLVKPYALSLLTHLPSINLVTYQPYYNKLLDLIFIGLLTCLSFCLFVPFALLLKCFQKEDVLLFSKITRRMGMPVIITDKLEKILSFGIPDSN